MEAVHAALVSAFRILPTDRNVRLVVHEPHRFVCPPHLAQPELYTHVSIDAFAGRSLDAKRALYRGIVENLGALGILAQWQRARRATPWRGSTPPTSSGGAPQPPLGKPRAPRSGGHSRSRRARAIRDDVAELRRAERRRPRRSGRAGGAMDRHAGDPLRPPARRRPDAGPLRPVLRAARRQDRRPAQLRLFRTLVGAFNRRGRSWHRSGRVIASEGDGDRDRPDSAPSGCAGIVTVNVPCGADQSVPPPADTDGPGSATVSENEPCGELTFP